MNPPPTTTEFPSTSSSISQSSSVTLNSSEGAVKKKDMAGFASLLNLKDANCTSTRSRRIQISQLGVSNRPSSEGGGMGSMLKKRWSFHSSNQINELLKEDRVMKPIISPKRRKSNSGSTFTRSNSETCKYSDSLHPRGHHKLVDESASSKFVLTNHQQLQAKHHQKTKLIAINGECSTSDSKNRQRLMDEYYSYMEPFPASYYKFRVVPKPLKYSREPPPPDYISTMPDEVLLRICKYLPKPALSNLSRTSRRFSGLIEDDTLWKRLCVMNKILSPEHLIIIMSRKPIYLRMARTTIPDPEDLPTDLTLTELASSSQLRFLDLSSATISPLALSIIMSISPKLIKLSLEHLTVTKKVVESMMVFVGTIEVLNLTMCYDVDAKALMEFFSKCHALKELNMSCIRCDWTKEDITCIISKLPATLQQLNISGYRNTFDDAHVAMIASRCPKLVELDVSDSQEMSGKSIEYILKLKNLQHLGLSRCYGIDPPVYSHLSGCKHLKYLDLFSLFKETSIRQLSSTLPGIEINKFLFSAVARPTKNVYWDYNKLRIPHHSQHQGYYSLFSTIRRTEVCISLFPYLNPNINESSAKQKVQQLSSLPPATNGLGLSTYIFIGVPKSLLELGYHFVKWPPASKVFLYQNDEPSLFILCSTCGSGFTKMTISTLTPGIATLIPVNATHTFRQIVYLWLQLHSKLNMRRSSNELESSIVSEFCFKFKTSDLKWVRDKFSNYFFDKKGECLVQSLAIKLNYSLELALNNMTPWKNLHIVMKGVRNKDRIISGCIYPFGMESHGFKYIMFIDMSENRGYINLGAFFRPFSTIIWISLVVVMGLMSFNLSCVLYCQSKITFHPLFWITSVLLDQGDTGLTSWRKLWYLIILWLFGALLLRNMYTADMFSFIVSEPEYSFPSSLGELVQRPDFNLITNELNDLIYYFETTEYQYRNHSIYRKLMQRLEYFKYTVNLQDILKNMSQIYPIQLAKNVGTLQTKRFDVLKKFAFISSVPWYTDRRGEPLDFLIGLLGKRNIKQSFQPPFLSQYSFWQGRKDFFSETFQSNLAALVESGMYFRWGQVDEVAHLCSFLRSFLGQNENNNLGNETLLTSSLLSNVTTRRVLSQLMLDKQFDLLNKLRKQSTLKRNHPVRMALFCYLVLASFVVKLTCCVPPQENLHVQHLKEYAEAEYVFLQLVTQCTVFYFGNPLDTLLFARFLDICVLTMSGYCKQLQSSSEIAQNYSYWTQYKVSEHITDTIGNYSFTKYSDTCVVLLPFTDDFRMDKSFVSTVFYSGRVSPNFVFISTPKSPRNPDLFAINVTLNFFNTYDLLSSSSIIFMINEYENKLFLFCQPCGIKIVQRTWTPNEMAIMGLNYSFFATMKQISRTGPVSHGLAINLGEYLGHLEKFTIANIVLFWSKLYRNLENFNVETGQIKKEKFDKYDQICGKVSLHLFRQLSTSIGSPVEACLYKTVFQMHNLNSSGYEYKFDPRSPNYRCFKLSFLSYKKFKQSLHHAKWQYGAYYLPQKISIEGFQYLTFIDKQILKQGFGMHVFINSLNSFAYTSIIMGLLILFIILTITRVFPSRVHPVAILLGQKIVWKKPVRHKILCFILTMWLIATQSIRLVYKSNIYSFVASTSPNVPPNLRDAVLGNNAKYDIFVPYENSDDFARLLDSKLQNSKNSSDFKMWSKLLKTVQILYEYDLHQFYDPKVTFDNVMLYKKFILISKHPSKYIRLIARYTNNYHKLKYFWEYDTPAEIVFKTSEKFVWFRHKDLIFYSGVWVFLGRRNFFTENYFQRDLDGLIQSGIYSRWEQLMGKSTEKVEMQKMARAMAGINNNSNPTFRKTNYSHMRYFGILYFSCVFISIVGYLKEVVRFNIPTRNMNFKKKYVQL
ncbi:unnamed protein product [Orchesella dallaii]|uniref:F-box domain-containing protein n=1 Tax=Orchesella dallaii TaxID=48710 RepID=A0ABP1S009_9HEXA